MKNLFLTRTGEVNITVEPATMINVHGFDSDVSNVFVALRNLRRATINTTIKHCEIGQRCCEMQIAIAGTVTDDELAAIRTRVIEMANRHQHHA